MLYVRSVLDWKYTCDLPPSQKSMWVAPKVLGLQKYTCLPVTYNTMDSASISQREPIFVQGGRRRRKKKNPFPSRRTSACPQCPSQARPETPSTPLTPPTQVVMDTERVGTSSQKSPSRHPSAITKSIPVTNPHSQRCPFCPQALLLSSLSRILNAGSGTGTVPQLGGQSRVPVLNLTPELPHPS